MKLTPYEISKYSKLGIHYNILQNIDCIYIRNSLLEPKHETESPRTIILQLLIRGIYAHGLDKTRKDVHKLTFMVL
jgi:hypothetical protein